MSQELMALAGLLKQNRPVAEKLCKHIEATYNVPNLVEFNNRDLEGLDEAAKDQLYKDWTNTIRDTLGDGGDMSKLDPSALDFAQGAAPSGDEAPAEEVEVVDEPEPEPTKDEPKEPEPTPPPAKKAAKKAAKKKAAKKAAPPEEEGEADTPNPPAGGLIDNAVRTVVGALLAQKGAGPDKDATPVDRETIKQIVIEVLDELVEAKVNAVLAKKFGG